METVIFRKERDYYQRDTDSRRDYYKQASFYLAREFGISVEEAKEFLREGFAPGGDFEFVDPKVSFLHRENFEDRVLKETTMTQYLKDVIANNESLAPTFTSYCSPDAMQSLLSLYTMDNIVGRDLSKGEMFEAQNAGDEVLYVFKNLEQNNKKTTNNSLSGASLTPSTALFNPTTHSTLTTNCRNTTAYGNANNEKFIEGNRHYKDVDTILNNLVAICCISNMEEVEHAMKVYQLRYPTGDDVLDCIEYSRQLYFRTERDMEPVRSFVKKMKPLERAAFVYTGDFYHLYKHNKDVCTELLNSLIIESPVSTDVKTGAVILKTVSEDIVNFSRQVCRNFSAGKKPKDILKESEHNYGVLAMTAKNINDVLVRYQPIISAFWVSPNMPASTAEFPNSTRRSVLGGDTDSTLFTVQEWVQRVYGEIGFTDEMEATSDAMIFLAAQTSSHLHAMMCANYGVHRDRIFDVFMKNEYKFKMFATTSMAKHYWALKTAQEGNVFTKPKLELKGANMISSSTPGDIVDDVSDFLLNQMNEIVAGKPQYMGDFLDKVGDKEREIYATVKSGSTEYFRNMQLKTAKAYKVENEDRTPYWNHIFWNRTFGKVYGMVDEPPYTMVKVSLEIKNMTDFNNWIASIPNKDLVEDIQSELARIGRRFLTTAYIPVSIVQTSGIPDEILAGSNARKIVRDCCGAYYHIAESMGVPMNNKKNTRMIYDTY